MWYGDILPVLSLTEIKSLLHVNHPHDLFDSCILHHHYLRFHSMLEYVMRDEVFWWRSIIAAAHLFSIICDGIAFWSGAFCHFHFIVIIIIIYCYWLCIIVAVDGSIWLDISFLMWFLLLIICCCHILIYCGCWLWQMCVFGLVDIVGRIVLDRYSEMLLWFCMESSVCVHVCVFYVSQ